MFSRLLARKNRIKAKVAELQEKQQAESLKHLAFLDAPGLTVAGKIGKLEDHIVKLKAGRAEFAAAHAEDEGLSSALRWFDYEISQALETLAHLEIEQLSPPDPWKPGKRAG